MKKTDVNQFIHTSKGPSVVMQMVLLTAFTVSCSFTLLMKPADDPADHLILRRQRLLVRKKDNPFCRREYRRNHISFIGMHDFCERRTHLHLIPGMAQTAVDSSGRCSHRSHLFLFDHCRNGCCISECPFWSGTSGPPPLPGGLTLHR